MIAITGKNGQLATELVVLLEQLDKKHAAYSRDDWDITDLHASEQYISALPAGSILINTAAYNAVDKAEEDQVAADAVNAEAVKSLAELCKQYGVLFIHYSTDFVFGGNTITPIRPISVETIPVPDSIYAKSKAKGEALFKEVFSSDEKGVLIRTSWVFSPHASNFVKTIIRLASDPKREKLTVIEDQIGRPTSAKTLAEFTIKLIEQGITHGFYHCSNTGVASWYDLAVMTVRLSKKHGLLEREIPVNPIPTEGYPLPAKRPFYSVLDLSTSLEIFPDLPHWSLALEEVIKTLAGNNNA